MSRAILTGSAVALVGLVAWALAADSGVHAAPAEMGGPAAAKAASTAGGAVRFPPTVLGTGDMKIVGTKTDEAAPVVRPTITFDEKTRTVRAAVRFSRARGVVEWVLSSRKKHPGTSVMVSENWASDFAAAFARAGYAAGKPPVEVGEDRVRMPVGQPVEVDVIVTHADGKTDRVPASRFISRKSSGEPEGEGTWLYVGPQSVREADVEILVTELSGSVVTTNPRDSSAMIFWMPKGGDESPSGIAAYYAATTPLPGETDRCEIEIRPAGSAAPAAAASSATSSAAAPAALPPHK